MTVASPFGEIPLPTGTVESATTVHDGHVIVVYKRPTRAVIWTPDEARAVAESLHHAARRADLGETGMQSKPETQKEEAS